MFITFEGIDGCGKTTQVKRLVSAFRRAGNKVVSLREPGGTTISEAIRSMVLNPAMSSMCNETELLLYEAARAQLVREVIEPALARDVIVVCDRYADSTFAYQYAARGLDKELVCRANELGSCGVVPDITIVLDMDVDTAYRRATAQSCDRLEQEGRAFQTRVRNGYIELARLYPERVHLIGGDDTPQAVFDRICFVLSQDKDAAALL